MESAIEEGIDVSGATSNWEVPSGGFSHTLVEPRTSGPQCGNIPEPSAPYQGETLVYVKNVSGVRHEI